MATVVKTALAAAAALPALCGAAAPSNGTVAWARRLSVATPMSFPDACLQACPGLQGAMSAKAAEFAALAEKYPMEGSTPDVAVMSRMIEESAVLSFDAMCEYRDAFLCTVSNADACRSEGTSAALDFGASHLQCMCDSCPSLKLGYAKVQAAITESMMTALHELGGSIGSSSSGSAESPAMAWEMQDKVLEAVCQLHDGLVCVGANPTQCDGMVEGMFAGSDVMNNMTTDVAALKQQCDAKGLAIDLSLAESSGGSNESSLVAGAASASVESPEGSNESSPMAGTAPASAESSGTVASAWRPSAATAMSFPDACLQACPELQGAMSAKAAEFAALAEKYPMEDVAVMPQMLEESAVLMFDTMCEFRDAFLCASSNPDACGGEGADASAALDFGAGHLQCMCDSCPSLKLGYAKVQAAIVHSVMTAPLGGSTGGSGSGRSEPPAMAQAPQDKMLEAVCQLHDGLVCVGANPTQCDGMEGMFAGIDLMSGTTTDAVALKQQCDAKGFATDSSYMSGAASIVLAPLALVMAAAAVALA